MTKIGKSILVLASLLLGQSAYASITINVSADALKNANGSALIPTNALVILVADTGNDGFGAIQAGASLNVNGAIDGNLGDDLVLARWEAGAGSSEPGAFYDSTGQIAFPGSTTGWSVGDGLALIWFPDLTSGSTTANAGTTYGIYSGPGSSGSSPWTTPGDGSTIGLTMYTTDGVFNSGTLPSSTGNASMSVAGVPEPSRALLGMIGVGVLALRRRRR